MTEGWAFSGAPPLLDTVPNLVTLVEGSSFCIAASTGNIVAGAPMGLFVRDTRILSEWVLEVDGERLEPLTVFSDDPFRASYVTRARPRPGQVESTLLVVREREVSDGMRESVSVRNLGAEAAAISITLLIAADFADLFEVKEGRVANIAAVTATAGDAGVTLRQRRAEGSRGVHVAVESVSGALPHTASQAWSDRLAWRTVVGPHQDWTVRLRIEALVDDEPIPVLEHDVEGPGAGVADGSGGSVADRRSRAWRTTAPDIRTGDPGLARTLARSREDLGALRIFDPEHPERFVVAAGAPWFMALFGRDAILTSWMALPMDLRLALGTARALAELQGVEDDPLTEEQPGRILHERRFGRVPAGLGGGPHVYYGSADATPLFVMLVGELRRWGVAVDEVAALMPAVDRALEWIVTYGDRDGDGFVEYRRATDRGLRNQGWKDSFDGVNFADGRLAETPVALCEVQGYVYAAFLARAHFAAESGDDVLAREWGERAGRLKAAFNERFWLPEKGWYAVGLDRDKRPIDALASNMGHCLWTGIVDEERAASVAAHLLGPDLFSGWGIRTLGSSMGAYNPLGYHNGTVWPHDNAIAVAGLQRYGFTTEATTVATAILDAAEVFGGRLPELFAGFGRDEFPSPVPYPTSCSPQAWAAATPVSLLRSLLRLDPWFPHGEIRMAPQVPEKYLPLVMQRMAIGTGRVTVEVTRDGFTVDGLDPGVAVRAEPRRAASSIHA